MKKKILLIALMVMLLALAFSLSAFAAYEKGRATIDYSGQSVQVITSTKTVSEVASVLGNNATMQELFKDENALVVLADKNGKLFAFPTWYIVEPKDNNTSYVAISEVEYTFVNTLVEGSTFEKGAIRYIEFPHGMTNIRQNGVFGGLGMYESNVTEVHIPSTVTTFDTNNGNNAAFSNNKSLKRVYIEKGNSISKIPGGTFSSSGVEYIQFESLTELVEIDGLSNTALACDIDLSNSKLKTIWASAFIGSTGIKKISLPDTVESIGDSAFENIGSGYLASPYLPSSLTYVGKRFFSNNTNLLDTYIFPEGVKALADEPFQNSKVAGGPSGKELNLVFLGKVTGVVYLNGNGHQKHAEKVTVYFANNSLSDYGQNGFKVKPSTTSVLSVPNAIRVAFCKGQGAGTNGNVTGVEYIYITNVDGTSYTSDYVNHADYGFDFKNHKHYGLADITPATCGKDGFKGTNCIVCDKQIGEVLEATGDHKYEDDHNCTTAEVCTVCSQEVNIPNAEHQIKLVITYDNGYMQAGVRVASCENDGCEFCETTNPKALFTFLGYSKNQAGTQACVGYQIAYEEIAEFKSVNQLESFEYGVVAGVKSLVPNAQPLVISENKVQAVKLEKGNVVKVDLDTRSALYQVDFRLVGFEGNEDLEVLMCAYVYDGTELSYLQNAQTSTVSAVTINTISEEE